MVSERSFSFESLTELKGYIIQNAKLGSSVANVIKHWKSQIHKSVTKAPIGFNNNIGWEPCRKGYFGDRSFVHFCFSLQPIMV